MNPRTPNLWPLLAPLAWGFAAGSAVRNALWDFGLRPVHRPHARVISVGGIMAGGSGKTPVTLDILQRLHQHFGRRHSALHPEEPTPFALVSRGYGRRTKGVQVVSDGQRVLLSARDGGDEPVMMARRLLATIHPEELGDGLQAPPVIVAEDRLAGIRLAEERFRARVVVLDDAFSHRRVARDLDILVLNDDLPAWWWRPLPAGRLREWPTQVFRADQFVFFGSRYREPVEFFGEALPANRISFAHSTAPNHDVLYALVDRDGHPHRLVPGSQQPSRVYVACGIARPERFITAMRDRFGVLGTFTLPDHAPWSPRQREEVLARARAAGAEAVLVTEKDAVKWPTDRPPDLPVLYPQLSLTWEPRPTMDLDGTHRVEIGAGIHTVQLPRSLEDALAWVWHTAPPPR